MPFVPAKEYVTSWQNSRQEALKNQKKMRWFTSDVESVAKLIDEVYDRSPENIAWISEYNGERDMRRLESFGLKLAFLCSFVRDIRTQFACWAGHRIRVPLDGDRMAFMRGAFVTTRLDQLHQAVKNLETPLPPV